MVPQQNDVSKILQIFWKCTLCRYTFFNIITSLHFCLVLEGEMYQLSHMLTEQKSLMSSMMEMSLVSDRGL